MKKILISAYGMYSGGVESSLINLLKIINKKYEITLLLIKKDGAHMQDIPSNIKIITLPFIDEKYNIFLDTKEIKNNRKKIFLFLYKIKNKIYTLINRRDLANEKFLQYIKPLNEEYDIAIDYHSYGNILTGYIAKKVDAKKKFTWIHSSKFGWIKYVDRYLDYYDKFFAVSGFAKDEFCKEYPKYENKVDVFYNILDCDTIYQKSKEFTPKYKSDSINILTVGRLSQEKGYDLLIDIAKNLSESDIKFKWYVIGNGLLYKHIIKRIKNEKLEQKVILLGDKKNPYPFFRYADIYVQTSSFEGFGLTIAEAKIFSLPIVCSNIPTFIEQIDNNNTGYICEQNNNSFSEKIINLINDKNIR
jgi:glycosyltransferase involved in cell wall biosynthesis